MGGTERGGGESPWMLGLVAVVFAAIGMAAAALLPGAAPDAAWARFGPVAAAAVAAIGLVAIVLIGGRRPPAAAARTAVHAAFRLPEPERPAVKLHDVAGVDDAVDAILELVELLKMPDRLRRLGAALPLGVLLVGPRGSGKTLLARALAGEAGVPLLRLPAPELAGASAADASERVRALFERASASAPCVVLVEDLEAPGRRAPRRRGDPQGWETGGTLQALLAELECFDPRSGVVLMAATSRPDAIDPAMLRPGRFDRVVALGRPDRFGREAILRVHAQRVRLGNDVSLADIAARTPGLVGAELAAMLNEAALIAARRDRTAVMREDLEDALRRVTGAALRTVRVIGPEERRLLAAHEAGRAVAAALLPDHPDNEGGASLVPRDPVVEAALVRPPVEERRVLDEAALRARLVELVAGRVAEHILLGGPTTAARESLARARDLAAAMVFDLGMGPARAAERHDSQAGDAIVARLLAEAEARAREMLVPRRAVIEEVARRLAERERVSPGDLLRIVHGRESAAPANSGDDGG